MRIEDTSAYCQICRTLRANDNETERCIKSHEAQ